MLSYWVNLIKWLLLRFFYFKPCVVRCASFFRIVLLFWSPCYPIFQNNSVFIALLTSGITASFDRAASFFPIGTFRAKNLFIVSRALTVTQTLSSFLFKRFHVNYCFFLAISRPYFWASSPVPMKMISISSLWLA